MEAKPEDRPLWCNVSEVALFLLCQLDCLILLLGTKPFKVLLLRLDKPRLMDDIMNNDDLPLW